MNNNKAPFNTRLVIKTVVIIVLVLASPFIIFFAFVLFIIIPTGIDNYKYRNLGKELVGKYYVYKSYEELSSGDVLNLSNDSFEYGEVIQVKSAQYHNYFEGVDINLLIDFPCTQEKDIRLALDPYPYKEGKSVFHTAFEEINEDQVSTYCKKK